MLKACLGVVGKRIPPRAPPLPWVMGVPVIAGKAGGLGVHGSVLGSTYWGVSIQCVGVP